MECGTRGGDRRFAPPRATARDFASRPTPTHAMCIVSRPDEELPHGRRDGARARLPDIVVQGCSPCASSPT
jgi:hypothetical protein